VNKKTREGKCPTATKDHYKQPVSLIFNAVEAKLVFHY